jgi:hypothetical protein
MRNSPKQNKISTRERLSLFREGQEFVIYAYLKTNTVTPDYGGVRFLTIDLPAVA